MHFPEFQTTALVSTVNGHAVVMALYCRRPGCISYATVSVTLVVQHAYRLLVEFRRLAPCPCHAVAL